MKKTLLIIGAIAAGLYIIISFAKGQWNPLKWFAASSPADDCAAKNKLKNDGEECIICSAPTTRQAEQNGIIRNGVCVEQTAPINTGYELTVTKTGGAPVYTKTNDNFVGTTKTIAEGTKIKATALVTYPSTYFKINDTEWLAATDVGADTQQ